MTICQHNVIVKFCWRRFVSLAKFSYWSKFHVNIITDSGVMIIFFYKGSTRNPEIPVWVLPNTWRLGLVRDTKFGTDVSNGMLLNAAKCQGYPFYRFWVLKGKPTGMGGEITAPPTPPPPLRLSTYIFFTETSFWYCKSNKKWLRNKWW